MALPATATFTGTNGNEVRSLADWDGTLTDALSGGACEIQSNQAQASASGTIGADWYTSETFDNNQYATATIKAVTSGVYIGVAVRCSGTDNAGNLTGYLFYSDSADGCYIDKIVSGSYVATIAGPGTVFAANDVVRLEINGSALTAKVNGTSRLTVTDTAITTGRPGIAAYGTGASTLDDWEGGNLGSSGISGTLSATLAAATASSAGTLALKGTATPTLAAATLSSAAKVAIVGALTKTLDNATISAAGSLAGTATGTLAATLADATLSSAAKVALIGTLTKTLDAATLTSAAKIALTGALTKTLDAATVTAAGTIGSTGALTATLADATATTRGYHVESACIGGVLTVSGDNGRYFENDAGIVFLSGMHTWQVSGADSSPDDPPSTLDFDEFLTALTSRGLTFTKMWAMEQPKNWPNLTQYFAPLPWKRTGPGTANDGKPKFDLDTWDEAYFNRMREWTVRLGNAGVYVAVQLFQGWHYTDKGYSNTPYEFHPFNGPNNINSVDGDTNNDNSGLESLDTASSVYSRQQAYVRKVIDTVNDLDNVIFEVANEVDYTSTTLAWERAIAAYIKSYESGLAKQHPVGITKFWPNGDNAYLFASDIEWTSTDEEYPTPDPDATDGSMVVIGDSDHWQGLTLEHEWTWQAFTRGMNVAYMDEWNGWTYGTDRRSDADAQKVRNQLGYIVGYAARIDLANATPQGSLASTGYCLAKTTGRQQFIVYQPSSGSCTLNLTGYAGTFSVEYLRPSTGATSTGSTVAGNSTRTLNSPWAGEDYVAFVELSAVNGALTKTLDAATLSATGTLGATASGSLTATLAAATVSSAAKLAIVGTATAMLADATVAAAGVVAIAATSTTTLAAATVTSTASLAIVGTATATLESATLAATGATGAFAVGALTATLADATVSSTATLALAGATTATLDAATLLSAAALANTGALTATLASATVVAVGVEVVIVSIVAGTIRGAGASGTVHGAGTTGTVRA